MRERFFSNAARDHASRPVRPAAVAGRFYPRSPEELRKEIERLLSEASVEAPAPKAVIAPHAGYMYSGPIAASAFAQFKSEAERIRRVVLVGPAHFVAVRGLALPESQAFATPLGTVEVDAELASRVRTVPGVEVLEEAHLPEHSLEVELPFLQVLLKEFTILPILAGAATPEMVGDALAAVWGGDETRVVISSDLSHYHPWNQARELDGRTGAAIERLRPEEIDEAGACGRIPIQGLLRRARENGLKARTLDLRNSGDTAGPRDQVVGYGAFGFYAADQAAVPWSARRLSLAREVT